MFCRLFLSRLTFGSVSWFSAAGGSLVWLLLLLPSPASAQMMVCQTPAFWCSFPGNAPSGLPCYCLTSWGMPVNGYSINPSQSTPQLPDPEPESVPDEVEECLNGLGSCEGDFQDAMGH
jgi:hypothetical protein